MLKLQIREPVCRHLSHSHACSRPAGPPLPPAQACFNACRAELTRTNGWKTLPRGYCRQKCDYYAGAPKDVPRKAGRKDGSASACLGAAAPQVRAARFLQNPANSRYCKDKCGAP